MGVRLDIGEAVEEMRHGEKVARAGWNGKNMYIALHMPRESGDVIVDDMTEPYVYMKTAQGGLIPWVCNQADVLAKDWEIIDDGEATDK